MNIFGGKTQWMFINTLLISILSVATDDERWYWQLYFGSKLTIVSLNYILQSLGTFILVASLLPSCNACKSSNFQNVCYLTVDVQLTKT
jgi:hypothetical protein